MAILERELSAAEERPALTLGVLFPGDPTAPATWSGTPRGVVTGLGAVGIGVRPLPATPPEPLHALTRDALALLALPRAVDARSAYRTLRLARELGRNSPALARIYTRSAQRAVRRTHDLDALVQIGAGYLLRPGLPLVTYEDMTIAQAHAVGYPEWRRLSRRALRARIDLQRRVYERADACCATTHWAAASIVDDYAVPPEKVRVVGVGRNHGVDPPANRDWSTPRYLFVGWEWERKNGPAVVRAFLRVRRECPDATLDLVGRHPYVDAPGVTDHGVLRLTETGDRRRAEALYRAATCFVMPSRCEPSALAYVEAAHAGLPSIGTTVGGAADLIGDGGCVVDPADEDAIVDAMLAFADPARAEVAGDAARSRSELFTWPLVAARIARALVPSVVPAVAFL
jgi:glycosyltransferase involved in cell wall biosynthesis